MICSFFRRFLLIVAVFFTVSVGLPAQMTEKEDHNAMLVRMLEGYTELLSEPLSEDIEDFPRKAWFLVQSAINKGDLRFSVKPGAEERLFDGVQFIPSFTESPSYVVFTPPFLELWEERPAAVYVMLTNVFRKVGIFLYNERIWLRTQEDPLDLALMNMDAHMAEAHLIRHRLLPSGFYLGAYETYLIDSFEKDGLISAGLFLDLLSVPIVRAFQNARLAFEESGNTEDYRDFINTLGRDLITSRRSIPPEATDQDAYPPSVAVHTWLELTPWLISRIHNRSQSGDLLTFDKVLSLESEYAEIRRELETLRNKDMSMLLHIHSETLKGFDG